MEKLNETQLDQFLKIEKEIVASADHIEASNETNLFNDDRPTLSGLTITTSMTTGVLRY